MHVTVLVQSLGYSRILWIVVIYNYDGEKINKNICDMILGFKMC